MRKNWFLATTLALAVIATASCATKADVEEIVASSNEVLAARALLDDARGRLPVEGGSKAELDEARAAVLQRIDDFIATRPHLKTIHNALLIRKALIHLTAGQYSEAEIAFGLYDRSTPTSVRDEALADVGDVLVWWWQTAKVSDRSAIDPARFDARITKLDGTIDGLTRGLDVRYYLATLRSHMVMKRAELDDEPPARLKRGLLDYAAEFDDLDRAAATAAFASPPRTSELRSVPISRLRWYGMAKLAWAEYEKVYDRFNAATGGTVPFAEFLGPEADWLGTL